MKALVEKKMDLGNTGLFYFNFFIVLGGGTLWNLQ
jgi:hypothetical protein